MDIDYDTFSLTLTEFKSVPFPASKSEKMDLKYS